MAEQELNIILRLTDEASKALAKTQTAIEKTGDSVRQLGRDIGQVGKTMTFIGAAITGPLSLAFKTASEYSVEANVAMNNLKNATINLQTAIGTALSPVIESIAGKIQQLTNWFNGLDETTRRNIIQMIFIGGILLTVGGAIANLIGKVIQLAGAFLQFAGANFPLLALVAAVALLIQNWERARMVIIPILNAIEMAINMVTIGFLKSIDMILQGVDFLINGLEKVVDVLALMPGPQQNFFKGLSDSIDNIKIKLDESTGFIQTWISEIETSMASQMTTGQGSLATWADQSVAGIQNLGANFQKFITDFQSGATTKIPAATKTIDTSLKGISQTFTLMAGYANQLGSSIVAMLQQAGGENQKYAGLVKAIGIMQAVINTAVGITKAFADVPYPLSIAAAAMIAATGAVQIATITAAKMHSGGIIRAHNGMSLAGDEVPIIAQTGEGILSRRGMSALGGTGTLNALNAGVNMGGGSSVTVYMDRVDFRNDQDAELVFSQLSDMIEEKRRGKI